MKLVNSLAIAAIISLFSATAMAVPAAGDAEAGKAKSATCAACHGADGNSAIPVNPSLAGQNYSYLVQVLKDYRSGARKNPIMMGQAAPLKDEDIADLAKYFSTQSGKLVPMTAK